MAVKVCSTALRQGGLDVKVGDVLDSSHWAVVAYPSNFAGANKLNVIDTNGAYATPVVLTADQSGSTILVDDAAGLDFTLPAIGANDLGIWYRFVVTTTVTSNNFRVTAASGDLLNGAVGIVDFDTANTVSYFAADGSDDLVLTMNGGTKGGKKGTDITFIAISATGWWVSGNAFGDGALATPFS